MLREFRECSAPRHGIAERRHLRHVPGVGEEDALTCRRVQHGRVEGDLTARIDRRDNRLRGDIEPIEPAAAGRRQPGPDNGAQRTGFCGTETAVGCAATRTDGCAGAVDGVDGATHRTAAHNAATATPATSRRCQAAASKHRSVAQHAGLQRGHVVAQHLDVAVRLAAGGESESP